MVYLRVILIVAFVCLSGCTSTRLQKARSEFYSGPFDRAVDVLDECRGVPKKDRLLCYMEGGAVLYDRGAYNESTEVFLRASKLIKEQNFVSVTGQSSAVLINDRVMAYKGEYSERLWVHTYLMMDFLLQERYESALVEAR